MCMVWCVYVHVCVCVCFSIIGEGHGNLGKNDIPYWSNIHKYVFPSHAIFDSPLDG